MDPQRQALLESLSTHSIPDIEWIAAHILEDQIPNDIAFGRLALLLNKKLTSGHAAKRFNDTIDDIIRHTDTDRLQKLLTLSIHYMFPELYLNPFLETEEKEIVETTFERELCIVLAVLKMEDTNKHYLPYDESFLPAALQELEKDILYEDNYRMVCSNYDEIVGSPYIEDNITFYDPEKYTVKRDILLNYLANHKYVNPVTRKRFRETTTNNLLEKYQIEIHLREGSFAKPSDKIKTPDRKLLVVDNKEPLANQQAIIVLDDDPIEKESKVTVKTPPTRKTATKKPIGGETEKVKTPEKKEARKLPVRRKAK